MNFTSLHRHSLGATRRTKAAAIFHITATVCKPHPQICPQSPSARSPLTATTVQPRDSASLLSNKRVRGVVHGETMHLRPRVSTYSAVTENPCRYRHRHIGAFCQLPIKAASSASSCCWMRAATSTRATTTAGLRFQLLHNSGNLPR